MNAGNVAHVMPLPVVLADSEEYLAILDREGIHFGGQARCKPTFNYTASGAVGFAGQAASKAHYNVLGRGTIHFTGQAALPVH